MSAAAGVAGLPTTSATAAPRAWQPTRPIRLLVPAAPGSLPDATARPLADHLSAQLGQPVLVDNRPGAGGIVGMSALVRSAADGHTLALATQSQLVFNPHLFDKLPYDPQAVQPILRMVSFSMVLAAHPSLPVHSFADLIAWSRRQPLPPLLAVPPLGTPPHILALLLQRLSGMALDPVPFKGSAEVLAAALSGEVKLVIESLPVIAASVQAGKLRALTVTGAQREPLLPGIATATEVLREKVSGDTWLGLVAPLGTAPDVITRLQAEAHTALHNPRLQAMYERFGWRLIAESSPAEFAATVREESERWGRLIRSTGLRIG